MSNGVYKRPLSKTYNRRLAATTRGYTLLLKAIVSEELECLHNPHAHTLSAVCNHYIDRQ